MKTPSSQQRPRNGTASSSCWLGTVTWTHTSEFAFFTITQLEIRISTNACQCGGLLNVDEVVSLFLVLVGRSNVGCELTLSGFDPGFKPFSTMFQTVFKYFWTVLAFRVFAARDTQLLVLRVGTVTWNKRFRAQVGVSDLGVYPELGSWIQ